MRLLIILLLTLNLSGCVTVVMPPSPAPAPVAAVAQQQMSPMHCTPYQPPPWKPVPKAPEIGRPVGDYTKHLENVAERLARHAGELREWIDSEQAVRAQAVYEHQKSCRAM